jgi:hypothetical protein
MLPVRCEDAIGLRERRFSSPSADSTLEFPPVLIAARSRGCVGKSEAPE